MICVKGSGITAHVLMRLLSMTAHSMMHLSGNRPPLSDKRIYSLNYFSHQLLTYLGITLPRIKKYTQIKTWYQDQTPLTLDAKDVGLQYLGVLVSDTELYQRVAQDSPPVSCDNPDLIIEAEGRAAADFTYKKTQFNQSIIVADLHIKNHQPGTIYQALSHGQSMGILPYTDDRAAMIWAQPPVSPMSTDELHASITEKYQQMNIEVVEITDLSSIQNLSYHKATALFKNNRLVIGDSACKIHPLAGLGLNQALSSAFLLYDILMQCQDINKNTLSMYSRRWHSGIYPKALMVEAFRRSLNYPSGIIGHLFTTARHAPFARRASIKHALDLQSLSLLNKYKIK